MHEHAHTHWQALVVAHGVRCMHAGIYRETRAGYGIDSGREIRGQEGFKVWSVRVETDDLALTV